MIVLFVRGSNCTIYVKIVKCFRTRYSVVHDKYPNTMQAAVYVMRQMNNTRNNITTIIPNYRMRIQGTSQALHKQAKEYVFVVDPNII